MRATRHLSPDNSHRRRRPDAARRVEPTSTRPRHLLSDARHRPPTGRAGGAEPAWATSSSLRANHDPGSACALRSPSVAEWAIYSCPVLGPKLVRIYREKLDRTERVSAPGRTALRRTLPPADLAPPGARVLAEYQNARPGSISGYDPFHPLASCRFPDCADLAGHAVEVARDSGPDRYL